jgi:hypothetical protein
MPETDREERRGGRIGLSITLPACTLPLRSELPFQSNRQLAGRVNMRSLLLIACAALAFAATMTVETTDANAVVCARGVYRAGCAGARGAVVVRRPPVVAACRTVLVNGVWVKRCV